MKNSIIDAQEEFETQALLLIEERPSMFINESERLRFHRGMQRMRDGHEHVMVVVGGGGMSVYLKCKYCNHTEDLLITASQNK